MTGDAGMPACNGPHHGGASRRRAQASHAANHASNQAVNDVHLRAVSTIWIMETRRRYTHRLSGGKCSIFHHKRSFTRRQAPSPLEHRASFCSDLGSVVTTLEHLDAGPWK